MLCLAAARAVSASVGSPLVRLIVSVAVLFAWQVGYFEFELAKLHTGQCQLCFGINCSKIDQESAAPVAFGG